MNQTRVADLTEIRSTGRGQPKPPDTQLAQLADQIRASMKGSVEAAINAGRHLIEAKQLLPHGDFGQWLADQFGMPERSAQRYMQVAERFAGKSDIVSDLDLTTVYALSAKSVPDEIRDRFLTRIEAGERVTKGVVLAEAKQAAQAARAARRSPEQMKRELENDRRRRQRQAAANQQRQAQYEAEHQFRQVADLAVDDAIRQLIEAADGELIKALFSKLPQDKGVRHRDLDKLRGLLERRFAPPAGGAPA